MYAAVAAEGRWIGAEAPVTNRERETVETYLDNDGAVLFIAEADGKPVGWITASLDDTGCADLGMGIVDGYRRRGIGTRMMEAVLEWAGSRADRLGLDVFPSNDGAIALYRKFGFTDVELRRAEWRRRNGEMWDLLRMERTVQR